MILVYRHRFACLLCRRVYAWSLSKRQLGPGTRRCPNCDSIFPDGSIEWPELKRSEMFEFVFPPTVLGFLMGAVVVGIAGLVLGWPVRADMSMMAFLGFGLLGLPWVPYFVRRGRQIRESKERHERRIILGQDHDPAVVPGWWPN